jgi:hypothetical protein
MIGLVLAASFLPLSHFLIASTSLRGTWSAGSANNGTFHSTRA